jgi:GntR family transcriptional regulator of gluconate operon
MACRLAAERAPHTDTAALDAAVARMRSAAVAGDRDGTKAADFDFHAAVFELAGHTRLRDHFRMLHVQTRLYLNLTASVDYQLDEIAQIHADLADAIRAGDAPRAERLGGSHNTKDGEALCARLADAEREARPAS